jgi:hypothetical protein
MRHAKLYEKEGLFRLWIGPNKVMVFCFRPELLEVNLSVYDHSYIYIQYTSKWLLKFSTLRSHYVCSH